jgi:hypothetical protein
MRENKSTLFLIFFLKIKESVYVGLHLFTLNFLNLDLLSVDTSESQ